MLYVLSRVVLRCIMEMYMYDPSFRWTADNAHGFIIRLTYTSARLVNRVSRQDEVSREVRSLLGNISLLDEIFSGVVQFGSQHYHRHVECKFVIERHVQ